MTNSFWDKFWRDKDGHVAVWQTPNIPLWTWFIFMLASKIFTDGTIRTATQLVSFGALIVWAGLEIWTGASYFRRLLGLSVLLGLVFSLVY